MAAAAAAAAPGAAVLVPLLDARKGEVYAGFYRVEDGAVSELAPEVALSPAALIERVAALGPGACAFGEGYAAYGAVFEGRVPLLAGAVETPPAPAVAGRAAGGLLGKAYDAPALFALEPHYVRASEAEVKFPHGLGPGAGRKAE
jgi:tRNA threonylcarbamoyladenosine biosynthesis protein TsaB